MIYFRIAIFVFFTIALYVSIDCLIDSERALEHNGAWFSMYVCSIGCVFAAINPSELLQLYNRSDKRQKRQIYYNEDKKMYDRRF